MLFLLAAAWAAEPAPTLDLAAFTGAVIAANPEADVARAALERARASAEAAGPWPDPMVDVSIAPLSLATMPGWQIEARQDLPLWGVRRAAQDMAAADADAADARLAMMQLDLADMAAMAWADWYAVHRELELVAATAVVLGELRDATLARAALGRATQLDALAAQAELGWLTSQQRSLAAERDVVAYRINALLHQSPGAPVPPPPAALVRPTAPAAGATRPEVAEMAAMTAAAEAEARMAQADRLPMLGVMAAWTTMLPMPEHRLMAGLSVAVPIDQGSRAASQRAADAGLAAAHAEQRRVADQIALRIATAERRYQGQLDALDVLDRDVLPVARARVLAARDAFAAGSADVRAVLDAERGALDAEVRHAQALALLRLRARELEIARGLPLPGDPP